MKGHWGVFKTYNALQSRGTAATWTMVRRVCELCEVCAKFQHRCARAPFGQPFSSLEPGHTVYGDVIGPLPRGRRGEMYIHCLVDYATRLGDAKPLRNVSTVSILSALQQWIRKNGPFRVLVTDNAAYYASEELAGWCDGHYVEHKFIAPYRHQSVGMVERYHQTLINRICKKKFTEGGSWTDHVADAVSTMNSSVHGVMKFSPLELWKGGEDKLQLAHRRLEKERAYRNARRRIHHTTFYPGQGVLVWDERPSQTRFQSRWRGPYYLTEQISQTMWAARPRRTRGRGRQQILRFHVDQMQPFSIES